MSYIDLGSPATDRGSNFASGYTYLNMANSALRAGTLSIVNVWATVTMDGTNKVGTFYGSGTSWNDRDYETIGTITQGAARQFTGLDIDTEYQDVIGLYFSAGNLEIDTSGGSDCGYCLGDQFGAGAQTYTIQDDYDASLGGTGVAPSGQVAIDVGSGAVDGDTPSAYGITYIDYNNPSEAKGILDIFYIWAYEALADTKMGTFQGDGLYWANRDYESVGAVTAGSMQTFTGMDCEVGILDFLGIYFSAGYVDCLSTLVYNGTLYKSGDQFAAGGQTYNKLTGRKLSIYGIGYGYPRVEKRLMLEIRDTSDNLIAMLENAYEVRYERGLNRVPLIEFNIPADDDKCDYLVRPNEIWLRERFDDTVVERFRIIMVEDQRHNETGIMRVTGEGFLGKLTDDIVGTYDTGGASVTAIVTALLLHQDCSPTITVGTIELTDSVAFEASTCTILKAILDLQAVVGGYVEVDSSLALNWYSSLGEDKGQQIRYGKNLKTLRRTTDYMQQCQKLYAYGGGTVSLDDLLLIKLATTKSSDVTYGYLTLASYSCYDGWTGAGNALPANMIVYEDDVDVSVDWTQGADERTLRCAIADYNAGSTYTVTFDHADYIWNGDSDPIVRRKTEDWVADAATLLEWARLYMEAYENGYITYDIEIIDLSALQGQLVSWLFEELDLGSTVKIIDELLGISSETTIEGMTNPDVCDHPEILKVELSSPTEDITDVITDLYRRVV